MIPAFHFLSRLHTSRGKKECWLAELNETLRNKVRSPDQQSSENNALTLGKSDMEGLVMKAWVVLTCEASASVCSTFKITREGLWMAMA